jgi:hypothetical protein
MSGAGGMGGKTWVNTRARIQRFSDGRFFAGPVSRDVAGGVTISLPDGSLDVGDECSIQLFGWTTSLIYATCVLSEHGSANFRTDKIVHEGRPAPNEPRLVNLDMMGTIRTDGDLVSIRVLDVSPTGLGGLCEQFVAKDTQVAVNVRLGEKVIRFNGTVVNCSKASAHTYRIGLRLAVTGLTDHETWLAQFSSIA